MPALVQNWKRGKLSRMKSSVQTPPSPGAAAGTQPEPSAAEAAGSAAARKSQPQSLPHSLSASTIAGLQCELGHCASQTQLMRSPPLLSINQYLALKRDTCDTILAGKPASASESESELENPATARAASTSTATAGAAGVRPEVSTDEEYLMHQEEQEVDAVDGDREEQSVCTSEQTATRATEQPTAPEILQSIRNAILEHHSIILSNPPDITQAEIEQSLPPVFLFSHFLFPLFDADFI